jgi:acyl-CoA dehydrogenase
MDIHGGKGICLGPKNYLARTYQGTPISITVEGANILTRSMIIFGQGAIRCHPYVLKEIQAATLTDPKESLEKFDQLFFKHAGFIYSNKIRSLFLGLTGGYGVIAPRGSVRRYYQALTRFSAAFSYLADVCMIFFGGQLKRMEKFSGRLADLLSYLFIGSALLRRFELGHCAEEEVPIFEWSFQYILAAIERSLYEILVNFPHKWIGRTLMWGLLPWGRRYNGPSDALGATVAKILLQPCDMRTRLCQGMYTGPHQEGTNPIEVLERALMAVVGVSEIEQRIRSAIAKKQLAKMDEPLALYELALKQQIINETELQQLQVANELRLSVIAVDDFSSADLQHGVKNNS